MSQNVGSEICGGQTEGLQVLLLLVGEEKGLRSGWGRKLLLQFTPERDATQRMRQLPLLAGAEMREPVYEENSEGLEGETMTARPYGCGKAVTVNGL